LAVRGLADSPHADAFLLERIRHVFDRRALRIAILANHARLGCVTLQVSKGGGKA